MILNNFIATKKIIFAIDGVPVYAKVVLQQQRRLNMTKKKCYNKDISPIHLTPGTKLMYELEGNLNNYIINAKKKYKYLNVEIKLYPSNTPNEGELKNIQQGKKKILEYINSDNNASRFSECCISYIDTYVTKFVNSDGDIEADPWWAS